MATKKRKRSTPPVAGDPNTAVLLTEKQQSFAECYVKHVAETNRKRAVVWELQISESSYDENLRHPKIRKYIEGRLGSKINDAPKQVKQIAATGSDAKPEEVKEALQLASLSGLLVAYNNLLKVTYDPKEKKAILDSIRDMRHKFASEIEANVEKLHRMTDKDILDLFVELATDLLGQKNARAALMALINPGQPT